MMVVCGKIEIYENQNDIIQNPMLIVEVLSPSTESFDRGRKFEYYRTVASLTEYVLVSQKEPIVEIYFKQNEKNWLYSVAKGIEENIVLQSLSSGIGLKEIYQKVENADWDYIDDQEMTLIMQNGYKSIFIEVLMKTKPILKE